ncbi:MAG: hypothetical protein WBA16_01860 [Nonlabens sp.]
MNITILGLDQWGYNKYVATALEENGHTVRYINYHKLKYKYPGVIQKTGNFVTKTLFNYNFKRVHLEKALIALLDKAKQQDRIIVIKGDELSLNTLKFLKTKTDRLIAFFNDSITRYPRLKKIAPLFDKVYSFDPEDVAGHDYELLTNYIYFDPSKKSSKKTKYNIFNISSISQRGNQINNFAQYFQKNEIDYKILALGPRQEEDGLLEYIDEPLPLNKVLNSYVSKSRILLDIQRKGQVGLSFRVFEAIALNKKLITTNTTIVDYPFYDARNILVVDPHHIIIPKTFVDQPYTPLAQPTVDQYLVTNWCQALLN